MKMIMGEVITEPYTTSGILSTDPKKPRYIDVIAYPEGFVLNKVQMPRTLNNQFFPKKGSIVLILREDDWNSKVVTLLKSPDSDLGASLRGEGDNGSDFFRPGEVQLESAGKSFLYLDNSGSSQIADASMNEQFVADNVTQTTRMLGTNVYISNRLITNISLDGSGNIIIQNKDVLTNIEKANIKIDPIGKITINSLLSDVDINSGVGSVNITAATNVNITSAGNVNIKGLLVKLGNVTKKLLTSIAKDVFNAHGHEYVMPAVGVPSATSTPTGGIPPLVNPPLQMTDAVVTTKTEAE